MKVSTPVQLERLYCNRSQLLPMNDPKTFLDTLHHECDHLYESISNLSINNDDNDLEKHALDTIKILMEEEDIEKLNDFICLKIIIRKTLAFLVINISKSN